MGQYTLYFLRFNNKLANEISNFKPSLTIKALIIPNFASIRDKLRVTPRLSHCEAGGPKSDEHMAGWVESFQPAASIRQRTVR